MGRKKSTQGRRGGPEGMPLVTGGDLELLARVMKAYPQGIFGTVVTRHEPSEREKELDAEGKRAEREYWQRIERQKAEKKFGKAPTSFIEQSVPDD